MVVKGIIRRGKESNKTRSHAIRVIRSRRKILELKKIKRGQRKLGEENLHWKEKIENKEKQERMERKTKITNEINRKKIIENRKRTKRSKNPKRTEERKTWKINWIIREKNRFNKGKTFAHVQK